MAGRLRVVGRRVARIQRVRHLLAWGEELNSDLEIAGSIQAAGVAGADFLAKVDTIAEEAFDDPCT